jgi:hypothetical protein
MVLKWLSLLCSTVIYCCSTFLHKPLDTWRSVISITVWMEETNICFASRHCIHTASFPLGMVLRWVLNIAVMEFSGLPNGQTRLKNNSLKHTYHPALRPHFMLVSTHRHAWQPDTAQPAGFKTAEVHKNHTQAPYRRQTGTTIGTRSIFHTHGNSSPTLIYYICKLILHYRIRDVV